MTHAEQEDFLPDTVEECEEEIEQHQDTIDTISAQLSLHDDGTIKHTDPTWKRRATGAMIHQKRSIQELERQIKFLNGEEVEEAPDVSGMKTAINNLEAQLAKALKDVEQAKRGNENLNKALKQNKDKASEKAAKIQKAVNRGDYVNTKLKQYIADNAPELLPGAHACMTLAQAEFDAATQPKEEKIDD